MTTKRTPINIKDPSQSPKQIAMLMREIDNVLALVRVKDEKTKTFLSVKLAWLATKYFNLKKIRTSVDSEGFEDLNGMDPDQFYHNEKSLKEQGLREIPKEEYPSPYGGSLYNDLPLYRAARDLRNVEGRNWETLQVTLWEKLCEYVDMSDYHPRGEERDHLLGRLSSMQRLLIDVQNIMMHARDRTKRDVQNAIQNLPRSYMDLVDLQQELIGTVRALEMSHGKKEGSEEAETMRAMVAK